ncbi:50S ribosomal protein L3 glutamine methyltransferase [Candidatus Kinetoplastibacterium sorsogonicusi]|uniref:50S ribosomal protein L3 glutamine methyltransferase n=1 Tax=Candidatus Kinetoplastidibacterium kentomonadis TaxID=1576550 RepID=A0A3S7J9K9_9PROT|nr:50S ribosomal protein L3 N(5)-glutamine methyltransferase [Candidatus Kinetoplastibacterium sorsogonicusi]AWD32349.1 50S ribosomal protein L3 glutamine methyltransferase [Candidatus Kinetoplastibacterium sorsogonicusi]
MIRNIPELICIRDIIRYAVTQFNKNQIFFGHGNDNSFDEAVNLILQTLKLEPDLLEIFLDARLLEKEISLILDYIEKRVKDRIPIAYLTKESWLNGYKFFVDERVIIPRSYLAEILLDKDIIDNNIEDILDLCTGSGCLAILAAIKFKNANIDAIDISEDALEVANKNINLYRLNQQIKTYKSNLYSSLEKNKKYDLIICNPPYVNMESMNILPKEYSYEPKIALYGGINGMDLIEKIIKQSKHYLKDNGIILLEIGNEFNNFMKMFKYLKPHWFHEDHLYKKILMLKYDQL